MKYLQKLRCYILKPDILRLYHILDAAEEIIEFTKNKEREDLDNDRKLNLAVVHLLEIIGEAANGISTELHERYLDIPWYAMIGMRNRLIHGYFDIDLDVVWKTVQKDIPNLIEKIKEILKVEA